MQDTSAINKIKQRIKELQEEIAANQKALELLLPYYKEQEFIPFKSTADRINDLVVINEFRKLTTANEIEDVIRQKNRFLHINEIAAFLKVKLGVFDLSLAKKKARNGLDLLKKDGKIIRFAVDGRNEFSYYGLKEWLDVNGKIKHGHEYKRS